MENALKKVEKPHLVEVTKDIETAKATAERTPELIANEIINIDTQLRTVVMYASVEIGKRLVEAKAQLSHGEWGNWLKNSVAYSKSTANNYMKLYEEFGETFSNPSSIGNKNLQTLGNLPYSKALQLALLPKGEVREEFIEENDIENMSSRELQKVVKEKNEALRQVEEMKKNIEEMEKASGETIKNKVAELTKANDEKVVKLEQENSDFKKQLDSVIADNKKVVASKEQELKNVKAETTKKEITLKSELETLNKKIEELKTPIDKVKNEATKEHLNKVKAIQNENEKKLKALKEEKEQELKTLQSDSKKEIKAKEKELESLKKSHEDKIKTLQNERDQAVKKAKELEARSANEKKLQMAQAKYKIYFDAISSNFKEVLPALEEIKSIDLKAYENYKKASNQFLDEMKKAL